MTLLEKAQKAADDLYGLPGSPGNGMSAVDRLAALKALYEHVDKLIWDLKDATGLGLWKQQ